MLRPDCSQAQKPHPFMSKLLLGLPAPLHVGIISEYPQGVGKRIERTFTVLSLISELDHVVMLGPSKLEIFAYNLLPLLLVVGLLGKNYLQSPNLG